MDDQTDLFAQLTRLHAQGLLTDAEYEAKKAALRKRGYGPGPSPSSDQRREDVATFMARYRRNTRPWFLASLILILLIGGYFLVRASTTTTGAGGSPASDINGGSGPWAIESKTDPMTDATVKYARATFEGQQFNIEVEVSCTSTGTLAYSATSFDKEGKPAEMRSDFAPIGPYVRYQVRAGDDAPIELVTNNPQYNNQVVQSSNLQQFQNVKGRTDLLAPNVASTDSMARAAKAMFRLFMLNGEETVVMPQDSAGFRSVVDSCLDMHAKATTITPPAALDGPAVIDSNSANSVASEVASAPLAASSVWKAGASVSGSCRATLNGKTIMEGACSGAGHGSSIFMTAEHGGCSIELTRKSGQITGDMFAYKDVCEGLEDGETVNLGRFTQQGGCMRSARASLCLKPE
ncbi:MAG: SHOCT domain-containing protein [Mycobacteriaceae bacterium]|nr:SHOCT domain-containing protein [Mycobacteriaceae bacterium]